MNAHKFVADMGFEKAKRVLSGAPEGTTHLDCKSYFKENDAGVWRVWSICYWNGSFMWPEIPPVLCCELKQVVDSVDYLNEWYEGKIDDAYDHVERMHGMLKLKPQFPNLHSRIKLVEGHLANYELVQANKNGDA